MMKRKLYWVTMTDTYLSGWGAAKGKTARLLVECDTYEQATIIAANAAKRSEMKRIVICVHRPRPLRSHVVTYQKFNELGEIWTAK